MVTNGTEQLFRRRFEIHGAVQGVGFRPHVFRLAEDLSLNGWVVNDSRGVVIEAEGGRLELDLFENRLQKEAPPQALIEKIGVRGISVRNDSRFVIHESESTGGKSVLLLPDLAVCSDCLREMRDPNNSRYRYPFINCTNCGPRFSIVESLPYDRPNTSMKEFRMCPDCRKEYEDPRNRRFHAQPIACPTCGPRISLCNSTGDIICSEGEELNVAARAIREGKIIAMKGLGGFQLIVDASNRCAVKELRIRKRRGPKPFAIMCRDIESVLRLCQLSKWEHRLISSVASPIVLLKKRNELLEHVAPGIGELGVMLPYTPLHHLLMDEVEGPVVATSANLSEEPICIDKNCFHPENQNLYRNLCRNRRWQWELILRIQSRWALIKSSFAVSISEIWRRRNRFGLSGSLQWTFPCFTIRNPFSSCETHIRTMNQRGTQRPLGRRPFRSSTTLRMSMHVWRTAVSILQR